MATILLIEDNPRHFDAMENYLAVLGHHVIRKENKLPLRSFEDAIWALRQVHSIDMALLDIAIKGEKTGIDVAQFILQSKLPVKIIFTTYLLNEKVASEIAWIGPQFSVIPKINNILNQQVFNFELQKHLSPSNPLQQNIIDNIFIPALQINPNRDIKEQMFKREYKYSTKAINKNLIQCIKAGSKWNVPKNYSLFVNTNIKEGYLIHSSLEKIIKNSLDNRFVQINENTCINLYFYEGFNDEINKHEILIAGYPHEVTKKYKADLQQRLTLFKLKASSL
jgi:CheY-like chemotaxis protein